VIGFVRGVLVARQHGAVVVETPGGLGLEILVPESSERDLPEVGAGVRLLTHLIVREDHWQLCGFLTEAERSAFLALLAVNGVGPKVALALVGRLGPGALAEAVRDGQWQRLREVPGVGPKLAQRVVVELRQWAGGPAPDRVGAGGAGDLGPPDDEVVDGLRAMGLSDSEARRAVEGLEHLPPVERLREALRRLDRGRGTA
jgi:Holliday junction DNA helicase RuvA